LCYGAFGSDTALFVTQNFTRSGVDLAIRIAVICVFIVSFAIQAMPVFNITEEGPFKDSPWGVKAAIRLLIVVLFTFFGEVFPTYEGYMSVYGATITGFCLIVLPLMLYTKVLG